MKRFALPLLLCLLAASESGAQDLSGVYEYRSAEGRVGLELSQNGQQLTGVMTGIDGSINQLSGAFDGTNWTGSVQTRSGTGWFAAVPSASGLTLVVAALDAAGQPDIANGWQLEFARTGAAQGAGGIAAPAAPAGKGGYAAGNAGGNAGYGAGSVGGNAGYGQQGMQQPAPNTMSQLAREWHQHLAGKKVTYIDSYSSSGGGYSSQWEAFLCSDGTFHFRSSNSMSADVGGVFGGGNSSDSFSGAWRVVEHQGRALLQYQRAEYAGTDQGQWVALDYQNGETYFDGERVYVTADNPMCM